MAAEDIIKKLKDAVKAYPDFPKKGIIFRDFLPILQNPELFEQMLTLYQDYLKVNVPELDCIAGIESRGFLLGPALSLRLKVPFVPIRKPGKLPGIVKKEVYELEYGTDALEVQIEAFKPCQKVVVVDDLLATGGTMQAAVKLINGIGANVEYCLAVIELSELKGREKIPAPFYSLFQY